MSIEEKEEEENDFSIFHFFNSATLPRGYYDLNNNVLICNGTCGNGHGHGDTIKWRILGRGNASTKVHLQQWYVLSVLSLVVRKSKSLRAFYAII